MSKKSVVKNQHYISEFILRNFSNEKNQVYECLVKKRKTYLTNTNRSMSSKFTYEHKGLKQNTLEKFFSEIESKIAPVLNETIGIIKDTQKDNGEVFKIFKEHLRELLIFYYRSGALLHEYTAQYGEVTDEEKIELLIKKITDSNYLDNLKSMIIDNYDWALIKSANKNFLLSDQYISTAALSAKSRFINVTNRQMGLKDVIIFIPISNEYYFVFFNGKNPNYVIKNQLSHLDEKQTKCVNIAILNNSYHKCISLKEKTLKEAIPHFNSTSPAGAIAHYTSGYSQYKLKKEVFYYKEDELAFEFFCTMRFLKYKDVKRNDLCICGSLKKYKKCCLIYVQKAERIMNNMKKKVDPFLAYSANPRYTVEESIDEIFTFQKPELLKELESVKKKKN